MVDASGKIVSGSSASVTLSISGPGTIVGVDRASMTAETFRGSTRKASGGVVYALVRATGAGSITVSAKADGLTAGSATLTGSTDAYIV